MSLCSSADETSSDRPLEQYGGQLDACEVVRQRDIPLISWVGWSLAFRTGPFQVTSKYVLMVMLAEETENDLMDGMEGLRDEDGDGD